MIPVSKYSARSKETAIWALAQQDPDFAAFCARYQGEITLNSPLPDELLDGVIAVVQEDPALAPMAKRYLENAQSAGSFAVPGLSEAGILIAALFLLGTHIKIHKSEDGKWEFLLEHPAVDSDSLKKIAEILSGFFKK